MKTLLLISMILSTNLMAFDGGLEIFKKENMHGVAIKAEILRIELSEDKNSITQNDSNVITTEKKTELNISVEPDFSLIEYKKLKLQVSPLVGVSTKFSNNLNQSKVGAACSMVGGNTPAPECFNYSKKRTASLINGASLKLDIEPNDQLHFYTRIGAYNNESKVNYKPQVSVGFTIPW